MQCQGHSSGAFSASFESSLTSDLLNYRLKESQTMGPRSETSDDGRILGIVRQQFSTDIDRAAHGRGVHGDLVIVTCPL